MISKYISLPIFLISLALGILCSYFWGEDLKVVHVFPTPKTVNHVQYQDQLNNCYSYTYKEVKCPSDESMIADIPIQ
jgi:hypothetical protein